MKTIHVQTYTFQELSDNAKQKVLSNFSDINTNFEWYDFLFEDFTTELEEKGYKNTKILFSGFYSQGDGACFTSKEIDIEKFIKNQKLEKDFPTILKLLAENPSSFSGDIEHNYRYYFATSTKVNIEDNTDETDENEQEKISEELIKLEKLIENDREKIGNDFYERLQNNYEELTSEKSIIETIELNEYDFLSSGQLLNT
jgi:hypothetical protein